MCVKEQEEETQKKQTTAYTKTTKSALSGVHSNKDDNIQHTKKTLPFLWPIMSFLQQPPIV